MEIVVKPKKKLILEPAKKRNSNIEHVNYSWMKKKIIDDLLTLLCFNIWQK